MIELANEYGKEKVYNDFVTIYDFTENIPYQEKLDQITKISETYTNKTKEKNDYYKLLADKIFSILYMTMIAEENKQNTILGKRIKRLGVHMVIMENISPNNSANYTKEIKSKEIDKLCKERGF